MQNGESENLIVVIYAVSTSHKPRLHCHKSRGLDPGRARLGKKVGSVNVSSGVGPVLLSGGPSPVGRGRLGPGRARLGT